MGMRRAAFLLALLASCGPAPAGAFPPELVGTWAPADSKFDGDKLVEGGVLYLTVHGTGAVWGTGTPPGGGRILAWFDAASSRLYYQHQELGEWGLLGIYDPLSGQLKPPPGPRGGTWVRRSRTIPDEFKAMCRPELWDPERARQKSLVDGMTLYFPSIGYRELTPAQRAVDPNRFREEAMEFLKQVGEPPLHTLGGEGLEVYRLIRIGEHERDRAVTVRRDAKGEAWAEAVKGHHRGPILRERAVSTEQWADLERKAKAANLAELPLRVGEKSDVVDGWILEVWTGGQGKLVECPDPNRDAFRALCETIERLGAP